MGVRKRKVLLLGNPYYVREFAKWGLAASTKAVRGSQDALAQAVLVLSGGKHIAYIKFATAFVEAVGYALPHGVGPEHPAYIKMVECPLSGSWRMYACYLDGSAAVALVRYGHRPAWLKRLRKV